ncbi:MAG: ribokinase [Pseudomonadota bacterium]
MIVVFGSINMDLNLRVKEFPSPGETLLSKSYSMTPGGKGANQALAAARIGVKTALIGKVGDDGPGIRVQKVLRRNEVITSGVTVDDDLPTGMAMVVKNKAGENQIIVASGANAAVSAEQAPAEILNENNILLVQMELPIEQNAIVMKTARENGAKIVMNLAPAMEVPKPMLMLTDYLIVNQIEARQLGEHLKINVDQKPEKLAYALAKEGKLTCVLTMGAEGSVLVTHDGKAWSMASIKVEDVIDTTGAGDCFSGTFTACLHEGKNHEVAIRYATAAAALSIQKEGALDSYPYLGDVEEMLEQAPALKEIKL